MFSLKFIYLVSLIPFALIWILLFYLRKDLRKEMIFMSLLIGILSVITSYYWWTLDWWRPLGVFQNTILEDFIMGFTSGGIMATLYEVLFKRTFYKRKMHHHMSGGLTILLILAQMTSWFVYGIGVTTFWASTIAMTAVAIIMLVIRKDLFINSLLSGILMAAVSFLFYFFTILLSPNWLKVTYLSGLSGIRLIGIPIEEFVFWFLAGMVFGPLYEYWQGERLKRLTRG